MKNKTPQLTVCPGTLADGYDTFSPYTLRKMFDGKKVSHVLPYQSPTQDQDAQAFRDNRKRISISGVQEKVSMVLDGNQLRLSAEGEQGTYILKPIPHDLKYVDQVPANEHLTMQIARQVFRLRTAENALVFFQDGTPAYLTRRFDVKKDGTKWGVEDFASLAGKSESNSGPNFKYDFSYDKVGKLIRKFVPAWRVEIEMYLQTVLFNYLFSNGDAHLKNFAVLETIDGDYRLSPLYDLINTHLHVEDTPFALSGGLMDHSLRSANYTRSGFPNLEDFLKFGAELQISDKRVVKLIDQFEGHDEEVESLVNRSFLNERAKRSYLLMCRTRRNKLRGK